MKYILVPILIIGAAAISAPALADARDDVLAAAARCGVIADHRAWLDCYYGAAQPLRMELGLPPAPASQTRLVPGRNISGPALSEPSQSRTAYAPPMPVERTNDGLFNRIFGGGNVVGKTQVSAYSFDKNGMFTITLADGEVWQQLSGDGRIAHWKEPASRLLVTIAHGALGTDNLLVENDNGSYKVRRIRQGTALGEMFVSLGLNQLNARIPGTLGGNEWCGMAGAAVMA